MKMNDSVQPDASPRNGTARADSAQHNNSHTPDEDEQRDPVAQALTYLRRAGGNPQVHMPSQLGYSALGGRLGGRRASFQRNNRVRTFPTGLDGRADRSYRTPRRFHDLLQPTVSRFGWADEFAIGLVMNHWADIVGQSVAERTRPVTFHKTRRELEIQCDSTAWTTQLRYMTQQILEAIARLAGEGLVRSLKIIGPEVSPKIRGKFRV